jgi:ribosome maturation factor RimP
MHGGSRHGSRRRAKAGQPLAGQPKVSSQEAGPGEVGQPPDSDRLARLLEPVITAMSMDLEGLRVTAAGRRRLLRVVVDADGGVSLDDIALASRELSIRLDGATEMGELPYTLEVSSPGVDRPLTEARHWRRATGRLVVAPLKSPAADKDGGNAAGRVQGRIVAASEFGVRLERDGVTREYRYAELGPGRVQVEFGHFDELGDDELGEED